MSPQCKYKFLRLDQLCISSILFYFQFSATAVLDISRVKASVYNYYMHQDQNNDILHLYSNTTNKYTITLLFIIYNKLSVILGNINNATKCT